MKSNFLFFSTKNSYFVETGSKGIRLYYTLYPALTLYPSPSCAHAWFRLNKKNYSEFFKSFFKQKFAPVWMNFFFFNCKSFLCLSSDLKDVTLISQFFLTGKKMTLSHWKVIRYIVPQSHFFLSKECFWNRFCTSYYFSVYTKNFNIFARLRELNPYNSDPFRNFFYPGMLQTKIV